MRSKTAQKLSQALIIIRDSYNAKSNDHSYSRWKLALAEQYLDDICTYIDKHSSDVERDFLFSCFGTLDEIKEEGDSTKLSHFAHAIHRVPFVFSGKEKWNKSFKQEHILPFCQMYGDEYFSGILEMRVPQHIHPQTSTKTIYRYNEINIISLPGYFCLRMLIAILVLPALIGMMIYIHVSDYTDTDHGDRYEITVTSCEYEHTQEYDYLYISCKEHEETFDISRFFQYSNSPEKLIELCESGATLIAYAEYKEPKNYENYYEVIQLEDKNGTVYRSYEHANEMDRYSLLFLLTGALIIFVPSLTLFMLMLIVVLRPEKFVAHPRFVKFCFPDYSLPLK